MEPNPKVIGSSISQKIMFSVAIWGLSFHHKITDALTYHEIPNIPIKIDTMAPGLRARV